MAISGRGDSGRNKMVVQRLAAVAVISLCLGLASCGDTTTCSSPDSMGASTNLLRDGIQKASMIKAKRDDGTMTTSESAIRAALTLVKISFQDIRTTKSDPNSTKKFCTATAKIVFPLNTISDADRAREIQSLDTVASLTQSAGIERNADVFTFPIDYDVQPTDDKKSTFASSGSIGNQLDALADIVVAYLSKSTLEGQYQAQQQAQKAQEEEQAQALQQEKQATLDEAKAENALSVQAINALWDGMDPDARAQVLDVQRAWVKQKDAQCVIQAASASIDPLEKETARLKCDTAQNQDRMNWIRQNSTAPDN